MSKDRREVDARYNASAKGRARAAKYRSSAKARACYARYDASAKGQARAVRHASSTRGRATQEARNARNNKRRCFIGRHYAGNADTAARAAVVNAHIKDKLNAFVSGLASRAEAEGV